MHTASALVALRQQKREFIAYLASHGGRTEPCESFFGTHARQLRVVLPCSGYGAVAVEVVAPWKHFREGSQERLAQICPHCGIALRGQLHESRRAQGLLEHYCALSKGGQLPDCVKQRVAFLYATQPLELDVSAYAGVHAPWVEVCRGQGGLDVHRAAAAQAQARLPRLRRAGEVRHRPAAAPQALCPVPQMAQNPARAHPFYPRRREVVVPNLGLGNGALLPRHHSKNPWKKRPQT